MSAVVRAPGVELSKDAQFEVFFKPAEKRKRKQPMLIEGSAPSNPAIAYEGSQDTNQRYCLIMKDSATGKLEILETLLFEVKPFVKKLRERDLESTIRQSGVKNSQMRTALGEAFGTKKAKSAISDIVRNRLEADMLEGLETAIVDNVQGRTRHLPSAEERQQTVEAVRPIPPYDLETSNVAEIYALESIVPVNELDLVLPIVDELLECSVAERYGKLPFKGSDFINARIDQVLSDDSNVRPRLRILVYLSFLRSVYEHRRATSKQVLMERVGSLPMQLFDGVICRFTTARTGKFGKVKDRSFVFDPYNVDKLLCYILALCLHANDFEADVTPLAHELSTKISKVVNLFRNLGCSTRTASPAEAKARDLTPGQAASYRIAVLMAPLSLPDVVRRKRA